MITSFIKSVLFKMGIYARPIKSMPYGIHVWLDAQRITVALGMDVETIFDVGANIGQTTRTALEHFPQARVFAFEPLEETYRNLVNNVKAEKFFPHQLALSDEPGTAPFYVYESNLLASTIPNANFQGKFNTKHVETIVPVTTIDGFCAEHGIDRIDILKIDTEGADIKVLKGATGMLGKGAIGMVLFEFNDFVPREGSFGGSLVEIAQFLSGFGIRFLATYTVYVDGKEGIFVVADCLAVRDPDRAKQLA